MRNVFVHDYVDVDPPLVWKTEREDPPGLIERPNATLEPGSVLLKPTAELHVEASRSRTTSRRALGIK